jgi:hypothetical protein
MRRAPRRIALLASALLVACGLNLHGSAEPFGDGSPDATAPDVTVPGDGSVIDGSDADTQDGSVASDAGQRDGATDAVVDAASDGVADVIVDAGPPPSTSCKTLLSAVPSLLGKNGPYTIDPDGVGPIAAFTVYCDMGIDNGGWTLVGHSAAGGGAPFGWTTATGTFSDLSTPFSLNVPATGLAFTEILVADRPANSLDAGTRAYKMTVPANFVTGYLDASLTTTPVTVLGPCNPGGGPSMLTHAGGTSVTDSFFFRDNGTFTDPGLRFGLLAKGFDTYYTNCNQGADLKASQGLVFVR